MSNSPECARVQVLFDEAKGKGTEAEVALRDLLDIGIKRIALALHASYSAVPSDSLVDVASDAAQDLCVRPGLKEFPSVWAAWRYAFKSARSRAMKLQRLQQKKHGKALDGVPDDVDEPADPMDLLPGHDAPPEEDAELTDRIQQFLRRHSLRFRSVFEMLRTGKPDRHELAKELGVSLRTIFRVEKEVREAAEQFFGGFEDDEKTEEL